MKIRFKKNILFFYSIFLFSQTIAAQNKCELNNQAFKGGEEIVYKVYYNWGIVWVATGEWFTSHLYANKYVTRSMSRKGNCWDNAVVESFFKTLKVECVYHIKFTTREQAELAIFEYIEIWYNRNRRHSAING